MKYGVAFTLFLAGFILLPFVVKSMSEAGTSVIPTVETQFFVFAVFAAWALIDVAANVSKLSSLMPQPPEPGDDELSPAALRNIRNRERNAPRDITEGVDSTNLKG